MLRYSIIWLDLAIIYFSNAYIRSNFRRNSQGFSWNIAPKRTLPYFDKEGDQSALGPALAGHKDSETSRRSRKMTGKPSETAQQYMEGIQC